MRHNRRRRIEGSSSAKSVQLLSLSMFVMLLAFFIVLNAISTFEENRAEPILGSLENTFSTAQSDVAQRRPSVRPSDVEEDFSGEGDTTTLDRIRDLFRGRITQIEIKENKEQGIMMVDVPYADFSTAILAIGQTTDISDTQEIPFLPTLVSLFQTKDQTEQYKMDILFQTDDDPVALKTLRPEQFKTSRNKVGKLSRRLAAAGVPAEFMSIGLREGNENTLSLIFRPYEKIDILKESKPQVSETEEGLNE